MHITIDTESALPPYEQIRSQLEGLIVNGGLVDGVRLPPIRQLAGDLGLATNTVARAYRELEQAGLVETRGRHGTVVVGARSLDAGRRRRIVDDAAAAFVRQAEFYGAGLDEAIDAVRRSFGHPGEPGAAPTGRQPS